MKNNIKIDFTSRSFILFSHVFLITSGAVIIGYFGWYLYMNMVEGTVRIEDALNIKDRVTIEVIDMKKLESLQTQVERHETAGDGRKYKNPFVDQIKK